MKSLRHLFVALRKFRGYDSLVHPHGELALVGYNFQQAHSPQGLFLCVQSLCSRISMAKLERDTSECAGNLLSLSTNPFQLCHQNYLVVIGKAPLIQQERINHA